MLVSWARGIAEGNAHYPRVFVFEDPVELHISSLCAQLRHKAPVEVEAIIDLGQGVRGNEVREWWGGDRSCLCKAL